MKFNNHKSFVGDAQGRKLTITSPNDAVEFLSTGFSPFVTEDTGDVSYSTVVLKPADPAWTYSNALSWLRSQVVNIFMLSPYLIFLGPSPNVAIGFKEKNESDFFIAVFLPFRSSDLKIYRRLAGALSAVLPFQVADQENGITIEEGYDVILGITDTAFRITCFNELGIQMH